MLDNAERRPSPVVGTNHLAKFALPLHVPFPIYRARACGEKNARRQGPRYGGRMQISFDTSIEPVAPVGSEMRVETV